MVRKRNSISKINVHSNKTDVCPSRNGRSIHCNQPATVRLAHVYWDDQYRCLRNSAAGQNPMCGLSGPTTDDKVSGWQILEEGAIPTPDVSTASAL